MITAQDQPTGIDDSNADAGRIRQLVRDARRLVIKVGSSSLADAQAGLNHQRIKQLVDALAKRHLAGSDIILVSSGAIAAGLEPLGLTHRPSDIAQQQAAAAVGQGRLIWAYSQAFGEHGCFVAQILLTRDDLSRQNSYSAAWQTIGALTRLGAIPIVNENDTVATAEIKLGDNDHLAALVAELVRADALLLLSDVDGLYTTNPTHPDAARIDLVELNTPLGIDVSQSGSSGVGSGGMATKVKAARLAARSGVPVVLGRWDQAQAILDGQVCGTVFEASEKRLRRHLGWVAHASTISGQIFVDAGAAAALRQGNASLLAAGIRRVEGDFARDDSVLVVDPSGLGIARGQVAYAASELPAMLGRTSADLADQLGADFARPVIHRDDLVLNRRGGATEAR
ncbi:MAG: glutamate 5-kinase [Propionibacteriaceae bacterium]|jgi:glutamate 5-kinase|nr:glutamate 5-kinase [Propionibacteriaceae bacterium]